MTLVIDNIGELITNIPALGEGPLGIVKNASVVIDDDIVIAIGPAGALADETSRRRGVGVCYPDSSTPTPT